MWHGAVLIDVNAALDACNVAYVVLDVTTRLVVKNLREIVRAYIIVAAIAIVLNAADLNASRGEGGCPRLGEGYLEAGPQENDQCDTREHLGERLKHEWPFQLGKFGRTILPETSPV